MATMRQLTRNSNGTITFRLEDQMWNEQKGGMDLQPLAEITLAEETWRALQAALPAFLDNPSVITTGVF